MLKDEVKEAEQDGEIIETAYGRCHFCGQTLNIQAPAYWDEAKKNHLATESCSCDRAQEETARKTRTEKLNELMENMFGPRSERKLDEDTKDAIYTMALQVIHQNILKATIEIPAKEADKPKEKLVIKLNKTALEISTEKKNTQTSII